MKALEMFKGLTEIALRKCDSPTHALMCVDYLSHKAEYRLLHQILSREEMKEILAWFIDCAKKADLEKIEIMKRTAKRLAASDVNTLLGVLVTGVLITGKTEEAIEVFMTMFGAAVECLFTRKEKKDEVKVVNN